MLIKINYQDKSESIYKCDSCLKELTGNERITLCRYKIKKYDLCINCWKRIKWIIEKHKFKREV